MCQDEYQTFYWKQIKPSSMSDYFTASTDLFDNIGNIVGQLLVIAQADKSTGTLALNEDFTFIFDNGSMNFTIGFNATTFSIVRDGNYGVVSNKSGVYTNINNIKYYFQFDETIDLWKITFKFE